MLFAAETAVWQQWVGLIIILLAIGAIVRELEVRLVLMIAALALGVIAGQPQAIASEFLATFVNERFVIPLCCGMGFAHVMRHTGCDQHLVHLLVHPLTKARSFLVPGAVLVGFLVNMPIVSQSSTAVTIGAVLIPVMRAAGLAPATIGAALLLGCSIGGELLNPGAPEWQTVVVVSRDVAATSPAPERSTPILDQDRCVQRVFLLNLVGLAASALTFWWLARRIERPVDNVPTTPEPAEPVSSEWLDWPQTRLQWIAYTAKAAVPLLPLILLYLCSYPFHWIQIDPAWLGVNANDTRFGSRLIGFAMVMGVVAAAMMTPTKLKGIAASFFEGAGFGFAHIISLIVVAQCFAEGIRQVGIAESIGALIEGAPDLLIPLAGLMPFAFGTLCGSGMATTQGLFGFFAEPAFRLGVDPTHVGAVVALAAAAGRTVSPAAAVTLMCARMTDTKPLDLVKLLALPVAISVALIIIVAMIIAPAI